MTVSPTDLGHMQRAKLAFERTSVFAQDERFRITDDRADLVAISDIRAAAVILKREPSKNILDTMRTPLAKIGRDFLSSAWSRDEGLHAPDVASVIPEAIKKEIPELVALREAACGRGAQDRAAIIFSYQDGSGAHTSKLEFYEPHYDFIRGQDIPRLVTTYTNEPEMTTEFFAGMISRWAFESLCLQYTLASKTYPHDLRKIDAVKNDYSRCRLAPYDIALFHGPWSEDPISITRAAIHAVPLPQKGKQRLAITIA